jgi:uncharacterized protein (DUF302 family)
LSARRIILCCAAILFSVFGAAARADELLMARSPLAFPEAMTALQTAIKARGYTVSHVQRVDLGLSVGGFKSAEYRVVFFAKPEEIAALPARLPELAAYLPLKIVIFAEGDTTLLTTNSPRTLRQFFPRAGLDAVFERWHKDVNAIFDAMSRAE